MNLYELNKAGYNSIPNMTANEIQKAKDEIVVFLKEHPSYYYAMMNSDTKPISFTIFEYSVYGGKNPIAMANQMIDVAKSYGKIKGIEIKSESIEIWIQEENDCKVYLVFTYDQGVIKV